MFNYAIIIFNFSNFKMMLEFGMLTSIALNRDAYAYDPLVSLVLTLLNVSVL